MERFWDSGNVLGQLKCFGTDVVYLDNCMLSQDVIEELIQEEIYDEFDEKIVCHSI